MTLATNFKTDSETSQKRFEQFTRKALEKLGFKNIHSTENRDEPIKKMLDFAGVDAVAQDDNGLTFLASRIIQKKSYGKDYENFSFRSKRPTGGKTELPKLIHNIQSGNPRPIWHVQTTIDENEESASVTVAKTKDVISYVTSHEPKIKTTDDGTEFWLAPFSDLRRAGVELKTIRIDGKKITA